jgi:hypothetical protein
MSFRAIVWAFDQIRAGRSPSASCSLVLLKLADRSNDDGYCWPGQERIGSDISLSDETVRQCCRRLEDTGLIEILRRKDAAGRDLSNLYRLPGFCRGEGQNFTTPSQEFGGRPSAIGDEPINRTFHRKEAAARAPARTAADAAAATQGKQDQGRRRRGDETIHHGVEVWTPADAEGLQVLIDRHGAERVKEVAGGLTPATGHRAPYLSAVIAAFQTLESAEAQAAVEAIRQARLASSPPIDPEACERGYHLLPANLRDRITNRVTSMESEQ